MVDNFGALIPTTNLEYFAVKLPSNSLLHFLLYKSITIKLSDISVLRINTDR